MADESQRPKRIPKKKNRSAESGGAQPAPTHPVGSARPDVAHPLADELGPATGVPVKHKQTGSSEVIDASKQQAVAAVEPVADKRTVAAVQPAVQTQPVSQRDRVDIAGPRVAAEPIDHHKSWLVKLHESLWTMPAWLMSLLVHVIVFMALALVTAVVIEKEPEVVISTSITGEDDPLEEFSEIEMEEMDELIEDEPLFKPDMPEMPKLSFDESVMAPSSTAVSDAAATESSASSAAAASTMADTAGSPKTGSEMGKAVSFYGSQSKGNRFVFLIDNSPNMNNEGRMLMAFDQILRAVNQMSGKQSFYVVFYSNRAYPLFFPDSEPEMVEATRRNKARLQEWLATVELCDSRPGGGNAIEQSLEIARGLKPSTVFFLTDGDYSRKVSSVLKEEPMRAPLNVIGLMPSKVTNQSEREQMAKLQVFAELAEANNGSFTGVPSTSRFPSNTLIERNRDEPGAVWGKY